MKRTIKLPPKLTDMKALSLELAEIFEPVIEKLRKGTSIISYDLMNAIIREANNENFPSVQAAKDHAFKWYRIGSTEFDLNIRPRIEANKMPKAKTKEVSYIELIQAIEDHINGVPYRRKKKTFKIHQQYEDKHEAQRTQSDE